MRKGAVASAYGMHSKLWKRSGVAVRPTRCGVGPDQRLTHDPSDGASAPPALGAAAETAIDFAASPRRVVAGQRRANVVIGQYVTGTDDHRGKVSVAQVASIGHTRNYIY